MTILDQRLTQTEDRLSTVLAHSRNLINVPPQTASAHYPVSSNNPFFQNSEQYNHDEILRAAQGNVDYSYRDDGEEDEDENYDNEEEEACTDCSVNGKDDLYGDGEKRWGENDEVDQEAYSDDENEDDDYSFGEN